MEQCSDSVFSYCISCRTGMEMRVANLVKDSLQIETVAPVKLKREWRGNRWEQKTRILLPGYIFAYSNSPLDIRLVNGLPYILKVLHYDDGDAVLRGRDREFAFWLVQHGGIVGISSAVIEGSRVKVVSGPLKELEGRIVKVDKRKQIAKVAFASYGTIKHFWLSFEVLQ